MPLDKDSIQLLNTAVIKSKEKVINAKYEQRLSEICDRPAIESLNIAITHLAESQKISKDHAAIQLVDTVRELDKVWNDYVLMEGLNSLKNILDMDDSKTPEHHSTHIN